jgi:hypothetical protein
LFSCSSDGVIISWDFLTGYVRWRVQMPINFTEGLLLQGDFLIVRLGNERKVVFNATTGEKVRTFPLKMPSWTRGVFPMMIGLSCVLVIILSITDSKIIQPFVDNALAIHVFSPSNSVDIRRVSDGKLVETLNITKGNVVNGASCGPTVVVLTRNPNLAYFFYLTESPRNATVLESGVIPFSASFQADCRDLLVGTQFNRLSLISLSCLTMQEPS